VWTIAGPLLIAGLGGGMVTAPNLTLSLADVPVEMAGAAGGALQTAQRIGGAIGTAVLATIYYRVLTGSGHDYAAAVSDTLLCAAALMLLALLLAVAELARRRRRDSPAPTPQPGHPIGHL
jgi:MFS family permease